MSRHFSDRSRWRPFTQSSSSLHLAPYRVVLLRDRAKDLPSIVRAVMEVTRLCKDEATLKMWQAHHEGRSTLVRTYLERAELFVLLFLEKGLAVALEADE